jgi:hypothetical protein
MIYQKKMKAPFALYVTSPPWKLYDCRILVLIFLYRAERIHHAEQNVKPVRSGKHLHLYISSIFVGTAKTNK